MAASLSIARRLSLALVVVAGSASLLSFTNWQLFERDTASIVGNMRGTALTVLLVALPLVLVSMWRAAGGALRARLLWLGGLAYLAYNAVMYCFATHFNALFLLFAAMLALSFWSLLALLRSFDLDRVGRASRGLPRRVIAGYLLLCTLLFAALWLRSILPASLDNAMPPELVEMGLAQNPVWVLDFAFTFPLMVVGSLWLLRGRPWGSVIAGMMVIMLTIETASIGVDQVFGHLHDPGAPLDAVPVMIVFTIAGLGMTLLFLRRLDEDPGARGGQAT